MRFETPQADIDKALVIESLVTPEQTARYLDCMNGRPMSERVANPKDESGDEGRDVRDGCILSWIHVRCGEHHHQKKRKKTLTSFNWFANLSTSDKQRPERGTH